MEKFKVEVIESQKYIIDVEAHDTAEAEKLAMAKYQEFCNLGIIHYHEDGDVETETGNIYNVTNTDDPFNP